MMRSIGVLFLIVCGLLTVTGCGQNPNMPGSKQASGDNASNIPPEETYFGRHTVLNRAKESTFIARGTMIDTGTTVELLRYPYDPVTTTHRVFTLKVEEVYLGEPMKEARVLVSAMSHYERPYVPEPHMAKLPPERPWTGSHEVIDGQ